MESQHSVGVPTYHDFPRFVFISEKSRPEVGSRWRCSRNSWPFWKKTPYWQIFINVFRKVSSSLRSMSCVQILWNLAERNSVKSCVIYLTKKNKISARALASALIALKISQGQLQAICSESPKFHPNPFTSSRVIAKHVNVVETRQKCFQYLVKLQFLCRVNMYSVNAIHAQAR